MKKLLLTICLLLNIFLISGEVYAGYQIDPSYRPINAPFTLDFKNNDAKTNTIIVLQIIAGALLYFATPVTVIFLTIAGVQIILGGAESEKIDQGKKNITWSLVGLLIIILSYSLVRIAIKLLLDAAGN